MPVQSRYAALVKAFTSDPAVTHVTEGKGFGSTGQLKVGGRIFAMIVSDELVLKLPATRIDGLVVGGEGRRFDAGKGKPMREWFVLSPTSNLGWPTMAREAYTFVKQGK